MFLVNLETESARLTREASEAMPRALAENLEVTHDPTFDARPYHQFVNRKS